MEGIIRYVIMWGKMERKKGMNMKIGKASKWRQEKEAEKNKSEINDYRLKCQIRLPFLTKSQK